ncbi:hypothetical protein [Phytohabitans houttuyneae]|uniref:Uncharacterized protein n=1 Tax=Phytohabitans houttuyneae TaxID=1076126 RepID=A0A6V8KNC0_9ACTN|nr:hypothetical protein [Phytohabitans houttuyneae]GFJ83257.1 hypothetical protein Phou_074370 [Phytohabitans houttuyneae]
MNGVAAKAFPGPVALAAWIAVTVPLPLLFFGATHRWEEDQSVSSALTWPLAALPVLAATVAARWTRRATRRGALSDLLVALGVATGVGALFLAASLAFYRWVIPLGGEAGWAGAWWLGLLLAAAGAAVGHMAGRRGSDRAGRWARPSLLLAAAVAVVGAVLAPVTVRLGAEDSTIRYDEGRYGGVGPVAAAPGRSGVLALPAPGRYAILAVGDAPRRPTAGSPGRAARRWRGPSRSASRHATTAATSPPTAGWPHSPCPHPAGTHWNVAAATRRPTTRSATFPRSAARSARSSTGRRR